VKVGITAGASTPDGIIKEVKTLMAEQINGGVPENEQSFEDMLNESFVTLNRGERVKGIVSHISGSEIYVDLGGKYTGVLSFDEITDDSSADLKEMFKIGDEIETQIIKTNDQEGTALLSRKRIDSTDNWDKIVKHSEEGTTAEGKVIQVVNGGIIVLVESVKVFVPASHANVSKDTDLQTLVGNHVRVKIIDVNQQKRRAIASIRNAENEQRKAQEEKIWADIEHGKKYEGVVKSIANYGAFVDIGGVDGMVHITELSWVRIKHPSEVVKTGDVIQVYIKDFDTEKRRISLGYRNESENPWTKFMLERNVGDIVEAKISSMMPFGVFAEITPGVDGLIHISEITDKRISKPSEVLNIGDIVNVKITKIDGETKKLSLSILAAEEAAAKEAVAEAIETGAVIEEVIASEIESEAADEAEAPEVAELSELTPETELAEEIVEITETEETPAEE
jgi:4-hydroxy-3-methylbut-2-enyl diphosphate reductase